jgi:acid phosphatase family membrane protein YuiD
MKNNVNVTCIIASRAASQLLRMCGGLPEEGSSQGSSLSTGSSLSAGLPLGITVGWVAF